MNGHRLGALAQPKSRKEAGNPEHVAEMAVGQQNPIESAEAGAAPEHRRCVHSPQSTSMPLLPASTRRPGWLRSADGTLAEVPRKVSVNILAPTNAPEVWRSTDF